MKLLKHAMVFTLAAGLVLAAVGCGQTGASTGKESATTEAKISVEETTEGALNTIGGNVLDQTRIDSLDSESLNSAMTDIPKIEDLLTKHDTVTTGNADGVVSFQNIYYGNDTKILKAIHTEDHLYKSAGYTEDIVKNLYYGDLYPGIEKLDFCKDLYTDEGDYFCYIIEYNELDDPNHLDQLYDCGCQIKLTKGDGKVLDGESYKKLLIDKGGTESTTEDIHSKID